MRQYHVLFYGEESERGWIQESSSIPFVGRLAFEQYCQQQIHQYRKDKKNYVVPVNRRRAWEVALTSAELSHQLSAEQRLDEFLPLYSLFTADIVEPATVVNAYMASVDLSLRDVGAIGQLERRRSAEHIVSNSVSAGKALDEPKRYRRKSVPIGKDLDVEKRKRTSRRQEIELDCPRKRKRFLKNKVLSSSSMDTFSLRPSKAMSPFSAFCEEQRQLVRLEHRDLNDKQISVHLEELWSRLGDEERSKFSSVTSHMMHLAHSANAEGSPDGKQT